MRLVDAFGAIDVGDRLSRVSVPTLVLHVRDDRRIPFKEGRELAASIREARFVPLEGRNHLLLEDEPAWPRFLAEIRNFLGPIELSRAATVTAPATPSPAPGLRLGHYEVSSLLGTGGMGQVYRARDTKLGRDVAIKILGDQSRDRTASAALLQEARHAAALNILIFTRFTRSARRRVTTSSSWSTSRVDCSARAFPRVASARTRSSSTPSRSPGRSTTHMAAASSIAT